MVKQIVSFSLSTVNIELLDSLAKAVGKNRSQFIEWMLENMGENIKAQAAKINLLQENLNQAIKEVNG